jgi:hypothetical protein
MPGTCKRSGKGWKGFVSGSAEIEGSLIQGANIVNAKEAASGLPRVPEQCQGPNPDLTPPKFVAPPGTCDCAVHVVGPFAQFPLMSNRKVTPQEATAEDYRRVMAALRIERAVVALDRHVF